MTLSVGQREARLTRIGASEVGALLTPSVHPFTSPQRIYDRLVLAVEPEVNEAMTDGQLAEPHVLAMARAKWRLRVRHCSRSYVHPVLPVCASPDATLDDGAGLVEVKCTGAQWQEQPPASVLAQVQCQLWLTHRSYAHVVVWNGRLRIFTVARDKAQIRAIREGVERFTLEHLLPLRPPEPTTQSEWEYEKR